MIIIDAFIHRSIRHWASRPRGVNEGCLLLPKFDFGASRRSYYLITSARRARSAGIRACGGRRLLNVPRFRVCWAEKPNSERGHSPSLFQKGARSLFPEALEATYVLKKPTRHFSIGEDRSPFAIRRQSSRRRSIDLGGVVRI